MDQYSTFRGRWSQRGKACEEGKIFCASKGSVREGRWKWCEKERYKKEVLRNWGGRSADPWKGRSD